MYRQEISVGVEIQGHPLMQWHRSKAVLNPSSLQNADNTSNAEEKRWVQSNQTSMEGLENWAECYGITESKTDYGNLYDFHVLAQECANLINPGIHENMQYRTETGHHPGATPPAISDRVHDLSAGNAFRQRHRAEGVVVIRYSKLQNLENTSKTRAYWVQACNQAALKGTENWVKANVLGKERSVYSNTYNINALMEECENIKSASRSIDNVNVNELCSYFDDILHIPKRTTEWADRMYT